VLGAQGVWGRIIGHPWKSFAAKVSLSKTDLLMDFLGTLLFDLLVRHMVQPPRALFLVQYLISVFLQKRFKGPSFW
jgi:hypothetical protein